MEQPNDESIELECLQGQSGTLLIIINILFFSISIILHLPLFYLKLQLQWKPLSGSLWDGNKLILLTD
jgi:hypothetical protein